MVELKVQCHMSSSTSGGGGGVSHVMWRGGGDWRVRNRDWNWRVEGRKRKRLTVVSSAVSVTVVSVIAVITVTIVAVVTAVSVAVAVWFAAVCRHACGAQRDSRAGVLVSADAVALGGVVADCSS